MCVLPRASMRVRVRVHAGIYQRMHPVHMLRLVRAFACVYACSLVEWAEQAMPTKQIIFTPKVT